jgi:hypothetical protein
LKQSGFPTIDPKKPLADKPTDNSDGDDEP